MRPQNPPQVNRSREKPLNVLWLWPLWSSGAHSLDPCGFCDFFRVPGPGCLVGGEGKGGVTQKSTLPRAQLTALDGVWRRLQGDDPSTGLRNVHPENQPHSCVLPADVCLAFAQLNVSISQLQDACTVNAARGWKPHLQPTILVSREDHPQSHLHQVSWIILQPDTGRNCNILINISARDLYRKGSKTLIK